MPATAPNRPKIDTLPKFKPTDYWYDTREPTKRPRLDSDQPDNNDQPDTKMIDTTGAEAKKMINHSSLENESDCEMNERSTKAESDDLNPLLGENKPELSELEKKWLWWHLFATSYSELSVLFCGTAKIDKHGIVHHAPRCNTPGSTLKFQVECDCKWHDERDPYDSESIAPLQQLKLALEQIIKE